MATKSVTFRCPDELLEYIEQQVEKSGVDRTTVMVKMLQTGMEVLGDDGITNVSQASNNVRQLISEALSVVLPQLIAPLQAQLDELRGKPPKMTTSQKS